MQPGGLADTETVIPAVSLAKFLSRWRLSLLAHLVDFTVLFLMSLLTYGLLNHGALAEPARYFAVTLLAGLAAWLSFGKAHLYDIKMLVHEGAALRVVMARWTMIMVCFAALAAMTHLEDVFSRLWFVSFYFGGMFGLMLARAGIASVLRRAIADGYVTQSVVVFGQGWLLQTAAARLAGNPFGIRVAGLFADDPRTALNGPRFSALVEYVRHHHVDTVVLALPLTESLRIEESIAALRHYPVNIRVLPGEFGIERRLSHLKFGNSEIPGLHLIPVADRPMSEFAIFLKSVFDRVAAGAALLVALPVLAVCAAGIKLSSPGPILFRQKRIGYKGHAFEIYKFRTMHVNAAAHTKLTERNDPRLFKFGSLIRRVSFDELPQLINVLKGDMSLVEQRPHMPEARAAGKLYFEAVTEYAARHRVKPGLTGWAQVNGWRGPTETITQIERRVEHDMYYIENWSLTLDLLILMKTVAIGFFGKNAF